MATTAPVPTRSLAGREVSAIGVGGAAWSLRDDLDAAAVERMIRDAVEAGVTLLDTAAAYVPAGEPGHNERLIARALRGLPDGTVFVSTKGGHRRVGDEFVNDGSPDALRRDCEESLAALGIDRIDLYSLHRLDERVPIEESVGALAELQREGLVASIGVSNVDRELAERALAVAPLAAVQNPFSPFERSHRELIDWCGEHGIAFVNYSPQGGWERPRLDEALPELAEVAADAGVSPEAVVLAWELALAPNVIPIVGASRLATVVDSLSGATLTLGAEAFARVDAAIARWTPAVDADGT